ncbi:hypothetical protein E4H04_10095 [Candidatus Bathyarchaeota archaeon]|jgi:predicted transcriptional regulator|nr:MAG: hypothetical protein E4H04_10095 [Candidatus Bathyarchaeota archaeon]
MSLPDLFFELSNDTRIDILGLLEVEPMRLTAISKAIGSPAQEVSRQLGRLDKNGLTRKDSEGYFSLTPYARHILELLPGFSFLYNYRDYFSNHSMDGVPTMFTARIGELKDAHLETDIMVVLHHIENMFNEAEEYIHVMLDQMVSHTLPILEEKVKKGVQFFFLTSKDLDPPPGVWKRFNVSTEEAVDPMLLDTRFLDDVPLGLIYTEKEVGLISFKTTEDSIDYIGFQNAGHKWVDELFSYYWVQGSEQWPEELINKMLIEHQEQTKS